MDDGRDTLAVGLADDLAEDLAGEFELRPLLERILRRSVELLGGDAGSICSVDEATGFYRKEADIGVSCQSGQVFPLTEGMTGAVVRARGPVHFADYRTVPGGHVTTEDRETLRGVVGVPILWRGGVVGACVVFSRDPERVFTRTDSARLELFARHAAIALANARLYQEAEAHARAEAAAAERDRLVREVHDTVAQGLASVIVHLDAAGREAEPGRGDRPGPTVRRDRAGRDPPYGPRAGAVPARGPVAGRGAAAGARLGQPDRQPRRPAGRGRHPGVAAGRAGAPAVPHGPGSADERGPARRCPIGADRGDPRGRHGRGAGPGRRAGLLPRTRRPARSGCAGCASGPG